MAVQPNVDTIRQYYKDKKWNERMVRAAVVTHNITLDECNRILSDNIDSPVANNTSFNTRKSTSRKKKTSSKKWKKERYGLPISLFFI